MKKILILTMCMLLGVGGNVVAQNKRTTPTTTQQKKKKLTPQEKFDQFTKGKKKKYNNFRDSCNAQYAKFLEMAWDHFNRMEPLKRPIDKPTIPEEVIKRLQLAQDDAAPQTIKGGQQQQVKGSIDLPMPENVVRLDSVIKPKEIIPVEKPKNQPQPVAALGVDPFVMPTVDTDEAEAKQVEDPRFSCEFYNTKLMLRTDGIKTKLSMANTKGAAVAKAWRECSTDAYTPLLYDCLQQREERHMCDWAYLEMLYTVAQEYLGKGTNEATLLTAFLFANSGYRMRLAEANGKLYLLYASDESIFGKGYFKMNGTNFYPLGEEEFNVNMINACNHPFTAEQTMSLVMMAEPQFDADLTEPRTIKAKRYKDMAVTVRINNNLMKFFDNYPAFCVNEDAMTKWGMYANTPMDNNVKEQIYPVLKEKLKGKSQVEQIRRLLDWCQTGLTYGYDEKIWGFDRAFFSEETLKYPFCDCEDHAILFTRIVRDVLGMKCVLIYYPGHLASAVNFAAGEKVSGDYVMVGDQKYYICDPTNYIAEPGVTMSNMKHSDAVVLMLE
ncbi:MAG: hypothetical protein IJQ44_00015 [Bacteroidaceae bacterium]|nr:hypothetical protein [Bacteroidaceae bacterium]